MLSSLTTSKRRRGLRGKASREKLPPKASREESPAPTPSPSTQSPLYSLDPSNRASTSSLASTHIISKMSQATSLTSFSPASFSQCDSPTSPADSSASSSRYDSPISHATSMTSFSLASSSQNSSLPKPQVQHSPVPNKTGRVLSPFEIFKLRIVEGTHTRKDSSASLPSVPMRVVRVAGRGGQGSRPRALPIDPNGPAPNPLIPLPPRELRRNLSEGDSAAKQPTRILGRGGLASRPRGLLQVASASDVPQTASSSVLQSTVMIPPPPPPPKTATLIQETPRPLVVYRPGGRGGAGSRPRKVKPVEPEEKKEDKDFKFPDFRWKGKGKAKAGAELSTNELSTNALTRTDTQYSSLSSIAFAPIERRTHQKPINPDPLAPSNTSIVSTDSFEAHLARLPANRTNKLSRTLGADFGANGRQPQIDPWEANLMRRASVAPPNIPASSMDYSPRRQSSYGSLVQQVNLARNSNSPGPCYPAPPQHSDDSENFDESTEDDVSEILEVDDDRSEIFSLPQSDGDPHSSVRSVSSGEIHVQPHFELEETDSEYGRADTPTQFTPYMDSYDETLAPADKRVESPFETISPFVSHWERSTTGVRAQEWSGEWNQKDMQSVIRSLRTLKS